MDKTINLFPRRFVFHGNAVAAGVYLTKVDNEEMSVVQPVDGQSSLPVIGGWSENTVQAPRFHPAIAKVFAYSAATTLAEGHLIDGKIAATRVRATVSAVQVTNTPSHDEPGAGTPIVFKAGMLTLGLNSTHPSEDDQPSIVFAEPPLYQDVSFNGEPVVPVLNEELMAQSRWDDLEKNFRTNRKFFDSCRNSFAPLNPKRPPAFGQKIPFARGSYAQCSFVRSIRWGDREIPGHVLALRGFGVIYFGEMLVNDRERRVTMVRMQLGSGNAGQAVFAENAPNGTWWPPKSL